MPQPVRPLAASAVGGGGGFSAVVPLSLREWRGRTCREVVSFSSSGKGGEEQAAPGETPKEARRRLAELDKLLEGLVEPKMRPPTPPPPPVTGPSENEPVEPAEPVEPKLGVPYAVESEAIQGEPEVVFGHFYPADPNAGEE